MNLEWKSNARYNEEVEKGSIFNLMHNKLGISIHHYIGCGKLWFFSCVALRIDKHCLETEDLEEAITKAKNIIGIKMQELNFFAQSFIEGEENILVRY